jgi:hypothetical protein
MSERKVRSNDAVVAKWLRGLPCAQSNFELGVVKLDPAGGIEPPTLAGVDPGSSAVELRGGSLLRMLSISSEIELTAVRMLLRS